MPVIHDTVPVLVSHNGTRSGYSLSSHDGYGMVVTVVATITASPIRANGADAHRAFLDRHARHEHHQQTPDIRRGDYRRSVVSCRGMEGKRGDGHATNFHGVAYLYTCDDGWHYSNDCLPDDTHTWVDVGGGAFGGAGVVLCGPSGFGLDNNDWNGVEDKH